MNDSKVLSSGDLDDINDSDNNSNKITHLGYSCSPKGWQNKTNNLEKSANEIVNVPQEPLKTTKDNLDQSLELNEEQPAQVQAQLVAQKTDAEVAKEMTERDLQILDELLNEVDKNVGYEVSNKKVNGRRDMFYQNFFATTFLSALNKLSFPEQAIDLVNKTLDGIHNQRKTTHYKEVYKGKPFNKLHECVRNLIRVVKERQNPLAPVCKSDFSKFDIGAIISPDDSGESRGSSQNSSKLIGRAGGLECNYVSNNCKNNGNNNFNRNKNKIETHIRDNDLFSGNKSEVEIKELLKSTITSNFHSKITNSFQMKVDVQFLAELASQINVFATDTLGNSGKPLEEIAKIQKIVECWMMQCIKEGVSTIQKVTERGEVCLREGFCLQDAEEILGEMQNKSQVVRQFDILLKQLTDLQEKWYDFLPKFCGGR
jgi:hypothetical protein